MAQGNGRTSKKVTFLPAGLDRAASEQLVGDPPGPPRFTARSRPDAQAHPLERRRPALHRGAHDARSAGGRRERDDRPGRRADHDARRQPRRPARARSSKQRKWDDYSLGRDLVDAHLGALDQVYIGVITSHRDAIDETEKLDPVTQDLLIEQTETLEQFHWFVRAHLEDAGGHLADDGRTTEKTAAAASARKATGEALERLALRRARVTRGLAGGSSGVVEPARPERVAERDGQVDREHERPDRCDVDERRSAIEVVDEQHAESEERRSDRPGGQVAEPLADAPALRGGGPGGAGARGPGRRRTSARNGRPPSESCGDPKRR